MTTWVVVADTGRARIFEAGKKLDQLYEVQGYVHGVSRDNTGGDPRGRGGSGSGSGVHHGLEQPMSIKEHDTTASARALAKSLLAAYNRQQFHVLVLIAAPAFLGELRKTLDEHVKAVVAQSIDKDLTRCTAGELEAVFRNAA